MTLVTIISKNLAHLIPIIFEFKDKIKQHILIYDIDEKNNFKQLKEGITNLNKKYNLNSKIFGLQIDEDSNNDFKQTFAKIKQIDFQDIYLNTTDADTTMVVLFSSFILKQKGKIISYDTFDNSYNLIAQKQFENQTIQNNMKIDDFFTLLNYSYDIDKNIDKLLENKPNVDKLFGNFERFFKLREAILKKEIEKISSKEKQLLKNLGVLKNNQIQNVNKISGVLFEEFIFWKLFVLDIDDIHCGVKLFTHNNDVTISNEFDVLMIKNNHIYTVECKLGNNLKGDNVVYKSDSLLELFGDDAKNLIINITTKEVREVNECMDISDIFTIGANLRANQNNISIYHKSSFKNKSFYKRLKKFMNLNKRYFLLGGIDLEMISIKKILEKYGIPFKNLNLLWNNAKLSQYQKYLNNENSFFGIELQEDITLPKYYTKIDHHNNYSHKKSSLEQVADILNIKLDNFQKLIAENDKGYIPAMIKAGASKEQILKIRYFDRKFQGVTDNDEKLAKQSITNYIITNNIYIIKSLTARFSVVVDLLNEDSLKDKILVYNDTKLNYYGKNVLKIVEYFKNLIDKNQAYYGGGENGFFGIVENSISKDKIKNIKETILKIV
jgi:hypothetical protein